MAAIAVAVGGALFSAAMQGAAASDQAAQQRAQHAQQEFQRKMTQQRQSRQRAREDAARWQMNQNIATAANKARAEEEFYLRYNFDNQTKTFSRGVKQANAALVSNLNARNLKGATAQALLRQGLEGAKNVMENKRIQFGNEMRSIERKQQNALGQRDFGYTSANLSMPNQYIGPSGSDLMTTALIGGVGNAVFSGIGAYQQQQFMDTQTDYMNTMMSNQTQAELRAIAPGVAR